MKYTELLGKFYNEEDLKKVINPIITSVNPACNKGIFHPGQNVEYYYIITKPNGEKHHVMMPAVVIARDVMWPTVSYVYYHIAVNIIDINLNGVVEKVWTIIKTDTGIVTSTPGDIRKHALVYTLDKGVETIQTVNTTNVIAFPSKKKD